jgi:signal transduction histidine kinase
MKSKHGPGGEQEARRAGNEPRLRIARAARATPAPPQAPPAAEAAQAFVELQAQHAALICTNAALAHQLLETRDQFGAAIKSLREEIARHGQEEHLLREQAAQLRALSVESTLEEQREHRRLSDLHSENLQQLLAAAKFKLAMLAPARKPGQSAAWSEVSDLLDDAVRCSREIGGHLAPAVVDHQALLPALCWLTRWMQERHQFTVSVDVARAVEPGQEVVSLLLFQSVRELLLNIHRHAKAATALVEVAQRNGCLQVVVSDDGLGFDGANVPSEEGRGGLGISNIRERLEYLGGTLDIGRAPGQGSRFTLTVPLQLASPGA